jgi:hypothetical protein
MSEEEKEKELREVALKLMRNDRSYFGTFPVDVLISWLEDRKSDHSVLCAYCHSPLLEDRMDSFNGTADHLLPKGRYPELGFDKANGNSVACCSRCNWLKAAWDPNTHDGPVLYDALRDSGKLSKHTRAELIERSRRHVQKKLAEKHASAWKHWAEACAALDRQSQFAK